MLPCLKCCTYLYVFSGIYLALFTLHWQLTLSPEFSQPILMQPDQNIKPPIVSSWLVYIEKGQVKVTFSSRETAAIQTINTLYNFMLIALLILLVLFMLVIPKHRMTGGMALMIGVIICSQPLLPWSLHGFNGSQSHLSTRGELCGYLLSNIILFCYLRSIIPKLSLAIVVQCTQLPKQSEPKIASLIAYASQSGTAALLAKEIAKQFPKNNRYDVACVSSLRAECLNEYQQVFFVAATYGDGDPPEQAMRFFSSLQKLDQSLSTVNYAVLALGDKKYPKFCAFGHQLAAILQQKGAQALLPVMEINQGHEGNIQWWWQQLTQLLGWYGSTLAKTWHQQQILSNDCLNPDTPERPAHHLRLSAIGCEYAPGDLVEILPDTNESEDLSPRTYSIASCQAQGVLDILVRKVIKTDGSVGLCSGYLTQQQVSQKVKINIKVHPNFHPPSVQTPLIMIAAGTGLAPFIGFLEQRDRAINCGKSWLMMGERSPADDNYFDQALTTFERSGTLHKRQHAWSNSIDSDQANYVGDIISAEQDDIRHWLLVLNAHLYICGSAASLGASCDAILTEILGSRVLEALKNSQQIKYDLY